MRFHNLFYLATIFIIALLQSCRHHFLDLECFSPIVCIVKRKYFINVSERDNLLGYLQGAGNFGACVFSTNSHLITSAALEWWAATSSSLPQPIYPFSIYSSQKYWRNNVSFKDELLVYFRMAALFARIIYIPGNVESSQNLSILIFSGLRCKNVFVYKGGKIC